MVDIDAGSPVSVSLPRFGGWRVPNGSNYAYIRNMFQSRCRDLGVGECSFGQLAFCNSTFQSRCRDLGVGEQSGHFGGRGKLGVSVSLPRFGGWRGSMAFPSRWACCEFQSRCRDLGVGEQVSGSGLGVGSGFSLVAEIWGLASRGEGGGLHSCRPVSVSLPRFGGWRAPSGPPRFPPPGRRFSLVAEIWGLARRRVSPPGI